MDVSPRIIARNHSLQQNENKSKFTCIPIGLTQGQFNLNAFKVPDEFKWFQMRSACLVAFCYIYIQEPLKWSSQTINTVVVHGAKVVKDHYLHFKEEGPIDCTVNVQNYIAKIRIEDPSIVETIKSNTSLLESLQLFFQDNRHGLFRTVHSCYLIWKTNEIYFLFDALGKGKISPIEDKNGFASLVCTELLKDVSKLLKNLSSVKLDDCYSITTIKMKHFRKGLCEYSEPRIQYSAGTNTYTVVNDCFGILCGKIHIGHKGFQSFKNQQAMAVGLMACIYNVIQPPNSWNSHLIDKVVMLGTKLFHECKKTPQGELTIKHLPLEYAVRDWKIKIVYQPYHKTGQMSYSFDEMKKNYSMHLNRAFKKVFKTQAVLIQTGALVFAVWENNKYYYLFDAYARNEKGGIGDDKSGVPCVHMHCSMESLCSVLCSNLDAITANDEFVLHDLKISVEDKDGNAVSDDDLELLSTYMDDLFWAEMSNFQETSARSVEVCNLDESSDDDVFMGALDGKKRAVSIRSSQSRSTASSTSYTDTSGSRTESSKEEDSNSQTNDDSDSQKNSDSTQDRDENETKRKSKSPKSARSRKGTTEGEEEDNETAKAKGKKSKKEIEEEDDDENEQSGKGNKKKRGKSPKNKGKKSKRENEGEAKKLVVVQSSSGTEESIIKLLNTSFKISDRVLLVTERGDFFVAQDNNSYILLDGCLCDHNTLRQMDLTKMDTSKRIDTIENVVNEIFVLKESKQVGQQSKFTGGDTYGNGERRSSFWELIEGMIELMKTTAKFDKVKKEMI